MLNLNGDTQLADGSEAVVVTLIRPAGEENYNVAHALKRVLTGQDQSLQNITLNRRQVVWNIPHQQLAADVVLTAGDLIREENGREWTILSAALQTLQTRWRAVCEQRK